MTLTPLRHSPMEGSGMDKHGNNGSQRPEEIVIFRLYLAGRMPNSLRALSNLKVICETYLPDRYQIEVIDILENPMRALSDDILLTPTLVKIAPPPAWQIVGNLSEHSTVLLALGLEEDSR